MSPRNLSSNASPLNHIAIIMDGNGRWAKIRGLPRNAGHRLGAEALRGIISSAVEHGVQYLTAYAFSSENWKRPTAEVNDLMGLIRHYLEREVDNLQKQDVRLRFIGQRDRLARDLICLINDAEVRTCKNNRLVLTLALSYGGRLEIVDATRHLARMAKDGQIDPSEIAEEVFAECLMTRDMPDPDLLIRTGGEKRLSNFLLWQLASTEVIFLNTLWPEFSKQDLADAIAEYRERTRHYGTLAHA